MVVASVIPPLEEEGVEVDGAEKAKGVTVSVRLLRLKLGRALSNGYHTDGTHDGEVGRLGIRDKGVANDPHDSQRKDKLITSYYIFIDIYEREYEMKGKVNSKVLNEGQQKMSTRLSNRIIVRQGM